MGQMVVNDSISSLLLLLLIIITHPQVDLHLGVTRIIRHWVIEAANRLISNKTKHQRSSDLDKEDRLHFSPALPLCTNSLPTPTNIIVLWGAVYCIYATSLLNERTAVWWYKLNDPQHPTTSLLLHHLRTTHEMILISSFATPSPDNHDLLHQHQYH